MYPYKSVDYYCVDDLLTDDHKIIRSSVRDWITKAVSPIIEKAAREHTFPAHLLKEMGELGIFGPFIPEQYGGAGAVQMAYGLIMMEPERGDSAIRSAASVQSSLVLFPRLEYVSEAQKKLYLPALASGKIVGSLGLTEANHGSDP
ncbi:MAG: acyl-CoA dehydrogenase family protein, partial [Desulfobacula sp.]|nr:acyl-CoA dehydrogenase family protein [Desulfobacula sp.]